VFFDPKDGFYAIDIYRYNDEVTINTTRARGVGAELIARRWARYDPRLYKKNVTVLIVIVARDNESPMAKDLYRCLDREIEAYRVAQPLV
jgi:hypothetical protein